MKIAGAKCDVCSLAHLCGGQDSIQPVGSEEHKGDQTGSSRTSGDSIRSFVWALKPCGQFAVGMPPLLVCAALVNVG